MTKRFSTGYLPDPDGHRRTSFRHLSRRLGAAPLPLAASLLAFAPPVLDQNSCGSCCGHATACGAFTALAATGTPLPWIPSPRGIYAIGRALDRMDPSEPLEDVGAEPNQVMRGISEYGVHAMAIRTGGPLSDCFPSNVNDDPTLGELEDDAEALLVGEYEIDTFGAQRVEDLKVAIAVAKVPVCIAIAGGADAFQGYTGGVLGPLYAPLDHYICAVGYETDAQGNFVLVCRNSWSAGWGEGGNVRLSAAAVDELGDLVAMKVSRKAVS